MIYSSLDNILVSDSSNAVWVLGVVDDGNKLGHYVVTAYISGIVGQLVSNLYFRDSTGVYWLMVVGTAGVVTFESTAQPIDGSMVFTISDPLLIQASTGSIFRLVISVSGVLGVEYINLPVDHTVEAGVANFIGLTQDDAKYMIHSSPEGYVVTMKGISKRCKIFFEDIETKIPYDPVLLSLKILDAAGNIVGTGEYKADGTGEIKRERLGVYYYDFSLVVSAPRSNQIQWSYQNILDGELKVGISYVMIVSQVVWMLFPRFRNMVDKARKRIGLQGVGFLEGNLLLYLQGGLDEINTFPPVTNFILDNYPMIFGQLLFNFATIVAMYSQELFSVDTDVSNYSDQGFSFPQDHQQKIDRVVSSLATQAKDDLAKFKWEYNQSGSVTIQAVPYYPISILIETASPGTLIRNLFTAP